MENLKRLLDAYQSDERTVAIAEALSKDHPAVILSQKMVGAQACFALTGVYLNQPHNHHIFIAEDKQDAAYIQNSLDQINPEKPVLFLPDSFKQVLQFEEVSNHQILQRTEAINKIALRLPKGEIVVSYPEAIFEKVVDPNVIAKQKIQITKDEKIDLDFLIEILVEYGFDRVEFVYEPGQFSIRGGIIDIFSFGNEWPYRVELFDEDVESIRTFNPTTQLSVRTISKISIIPNVNENFEEKDKAAIFDVLPKNTVVWIKNPELFLERIQQCFEQAEKFADALLPKSIAEMNQIIQHRSFIYPKDVLGYLERRHTILLQKHLENFIFDVAVNWDGKPQPNFNKNFTLLIEDLTKNKSAGITNYLFTDNNRQIERFYNIFEDLNAQVDFHPVLTAVHQGFVDPILKIACYTDHQIFQRFHRYQLRKGFTKDQAISLKMLRELQSGDFVVHIDHGIGKYSGLEKIDINGHLQESVRLIYKNNDLLYVSINSLHKISKYIGKDGTAPKLDKIGSDTWKKLKRKAKNKVKDIAKELIKLYAKRRASEGFAFEPDGYLQNELEASFMYEDTPDQYSTTVAVKEDMEKPYPMDRLICGDVGFGKTEIAIRAAFKAVVNGKQVAILVPTTILALQHHKTISQRLKDFPVEVDYVNRFKTLAQRKAVFQKLKEGKVDIVIGTHALLNKDVGFKDLGLLVIDEEQKFGVAAKEKLRNIKVNVDTLTLTATPIPRTLQFSLMAARDLSVIRTAPPNRQPIHTERRIINNDLIKDAINHEIYRGGQVFFVHNRVKSLMDMGAMVKRLCPDVSVAIAHGQMNPKNLEETLVSFIEGKYDVLLCTNIIETGLDIANANTIIINNAHQFGLSDLHQLRGRVGRSNRKAYCYLFAPPLSVLSSDARKRLQTLEEFTDLGSGFNIAMRDLDIRGAGNLLGAEQSGFIADIGYETFQKILEEAVLELKETEFKEVFKEDLAKEKKFVRDVEIESDIEMLIPDAYVSNIQERLSLYTDLDKIENEDELSIFKKSLIDRFGPLPLEVNELLYGLRLRWICKILGFERLSLKQNKLRCFFIRNPQSIFYESPQFHRTLKFISSDQGRKLGFSLKQTKSFLILIREEVKNFKEVKIIFERMKEDVI